jgi:hypothetical protein
MFNSSSFGFVKVAYVADYGNFHIIPHSIEGLDSSKMNDRPSQPRKQKRRINPNQGQFLTQMWRESGRKLYDGKRRTLAFNQH